MKKSFGAPDAHKLHQHTLAENSIRKKEVLGKREAADHHKDSITRSKDRVRNRDSMGHGKDSAGRSKDSDGRIKELDTRSHVTGEIYYIHPAGVCLFALFCLMTVDT